MMGESRSSTGYVREKSFWSSESGKRDFRGSAYCLCYVEKSIKKFCFVFEMQSTFGIFERLYKDLINSLIISWWQDYFS